MSIISGLIGNAAETDIEDVKKDYGKLLGKSEQVIQAYQWVRDLLIFTDYRLIPAKKSTTTPFPTRVSATSP